MSKTEMIIEVVIVRVRSDSDWAESSRVNLIKKHCRVTGRVESDQVRFQIIYRRLFSDLDHLESSRVGFGSI